MNFLCAVEPLTCPRHPDPTDLCVPRPVSLTEPTVIAREVVRFGQAYVPAAEAVFLPVRTYPERLIVDNCILNETLLLDVLTFLDANRERWTQHMYLGHRGDLLVGCLAGWAVVFGGAETGEPDYRIATSVGMEIHHAARRVLGLTEAQAGALFGFVYVVENNSTRHPTFTEFCAKVREVTGVTYRPKEIAA